MRFTRFPRTIDRDEQPSKARLTAAKRALQRERDKTPLFADEIAAEQPSPEGRIKTLDANARAWLAERRSYIAASWRASRAELRAMPAGEALEILREWQYGHLPGSHEYLANLIHSRRRGDKLGGVIAERIAAWANGAKPYPGSKCGRRPKTLELCGVML